VVSEGGTSIAAAPLSCVLLADRHRDLAEGVRGLLETAFNSVVMVADETSLLDTLSRLRPDVAVVDLSFGRVRGLGWLREVRRRSPEVGLVVLSVHDEQSVRRAVMEAGADAFVPRQAIATDLLDAVADAWEARRSDAREPGRS
jgi:DNA-binding NarL/FixJ family response regulator